ncbi:MAG: anhydro-N-acetylmuramic acid kinase [Planctomycetota bacterium]|nr:anhydro-N-acetylmuramic acid kinase [Planctomycetota bacterium]
MPTTRLIAGAMSGTSADGVDVALVRITGAGYEMAPTLLLHHHHPYPPALRQSIFAIRSTGNTTLFDLADLARQISLAYAAAVNESLHLQNLSPSDLTAIAAHGQTLFHSPPNTIQWLDPALIAAEVGCLVVSDFRRADCAAGGQGAPLVPFADYILFRHPSKTRILINIGGIANLTHLPPERKGSESIFASPRLIAFDTGPGNCLSDHLCRQFDPAGPGFDPDGSLALLGSCLPDLADHVLSHPYFHQPPPKSTDGPAMIQIYQSAPSHLRPFTPRCRNEEELNHRNELATAALITARALHHAITHHLPTPPDEIILSGGGTQNQAILHRLRSLFPTTPLLTTDDLGILSQSKEALAFALLAGATLDNFPSNIPSVTGATHPVVLGSLTPNPHPTNNK